ncbi:MAG: thiol-activated cytolysin family protein [Nannocystaceae bacterium]
MNRARAGASRMGVKPEPTASRLLVTAFALAPAACTVEPPARHFAQAGSVGGADDDDSDGESSTSGDGGESSTGELDEVSEFVFGLGHLDIAPYQPKSEHECVGLDCPVDGPEGDEYCVYVDYDETTHAHEFVAFQPNSATLWPGNVVRGDDAQRGILTPVGVGRAPMTFSVSLDNLGGSPVGTMDTPSLSAFRDERNRILAQGTDGSVPAQIAFEIERVFSESQVAVSVGGSLDWFSGSFSTMFDFTDKQQSTKILVDFTQAYYTIDVDTPGLPSQFFTDDVTVEQLELFAGPDYPPMYVQSVTYGRRVIFALESSRTEEEVRFALDASFDALLAGGSVEVDVQHRDVLEQSSISALVIGGSGADAVKSVTGFDGLVEYLLAGGDFSKDSPGAPIAYKLAYLDSSGVELAFTTEYSERQCYDSHIDVTGMLAQIEDLGGNDGTGIQLYGNLMFRVAPAGDPDPCRADAAWNIVFDRNDDAAQEVYGLWVPSNPIPATVYDVEVPPDGPLPMLCFKGDLRENDSCWGFCGDDEYGLASLGPIPLDQGWAGDHSMEFAQDGTVVATIRIAID